MKKFKQTVFVPDLKEHFVVEINTCAKNIKQPLFKMDLENLLSDTF